MSDDRNTGLGGSLLLQRTEPEPPKRPAVPGTRAAEPETLPAPQTPGRPAARKPDKKHRAVPRDKRTLHLDRDVSGWLDAAAQAEGRERSEIVSELLRKHLPRYTIRVRRDS